MSQQRRISGKWFVVFWIVVVGATLLGMQLFMFDRSKGKPSPKYAPQNAVTPADDDPMPRAPASPRNY